MAIEIKEIDTAPKVVVQRQPQPGANDILARARTIGAPEGFHFAGGITPREAWKLFSSGAAELVDVRTLRELDQVGHVPGSKHVEWLKGPEMSQNPRFIDELAEKAGKNDVVLFLCRSGKRSVAAAEAAAKAGFRHAFNVLEGFEGDGNPKRGWLRHGLPSTED
ncbi:MAG TPA: rhodanese-like domain-containing protein [Gallionella sp.]|nr:rhodanese-like domain-containing protein [Gallionella sp.]